MDTSNSKNNDTNLLIQYENRKEGDLCCSKACMRGSGIPFAVFKRCRSQMDAVNSGSPSAKQTVVCAMMTASGNAHKERSRLNYRVFGYDKSVCVVAFAFCYDIPLRTLKRW